MSLTSDTNDLIEQATRLLSPPDMSDWTPPPGPPELAAQAEREERERRDRERVDQYLADRTDRLLCLRAIRQAAKTRADAYEDEAAPWLRLAERQKRIAAYVETLARNVLEAERRIAGYTDAEPYGVEQRDGTTIGIKLNPPAVLIEDASAIPVNLYDDPRPPEPSKSKIAERLRAGLPVPGAKFVRGQSLRWK